MGDFDNYPMAPLFDAPPRLGEIDAERTGFFARAVSEQRPSLADPPLGRLERSHDRAWQVHREYASLARQVARIDAAVVRFSPPSAEREADTHAGSIGPPLLERAEQVLEVDPPR